MLQTGPSASFSPSRWVRIRCMVPMRLKPRKWRSSSSFPRTRSSAERSSLGFPQGYERGLARMTGKVGLEALYVARAACSALLASKGSRLEADERSRSDACLCEVPARGPAAGGGGCRLEAGARGGEIHQRQDGASAGASPCQGARGKQGSRAAETQGGGNHAGATLTGWRTIVPTVVNCCLTNL